MLMGIQPLPPVLVQSLQCLRLILLSFVRLTFLLSIQDLEEKASQLGCDSYKQDLAYCRSPLKHCKTTEPNPPLIPQPVGIKVSLTVS